MSAEEIRFTGYVALVKLPWGEGFLEPGDPVPDEPGRNYGGLLRRRQIGEPAANAGQLLTADLDIAALVEERVAALTDHELAEQASARGLHLVPAALPEEHLRALAEAQGLAVSKAGEATEAPAPSEDSLRAWAAENGFQLVPNELVEFEVIAIPAELPTSREALLQLALSIPLRVNGTGSKGYVKETDLREAIEAERARRDAPAPASAPPSDT